ncbi:DUF6602 domain-containing protein [Enterococcus faecalis]
MGKTQGEGLTKNKVLKAIAENTEKKEALIVAQVGMINDHGTTIGTLRETLWLEMFEQIIPKKFLIEHSVFIIDSKGKISREVDLAIMDEMYTPYIFRFGKMKFVPIEAVAVVVECKSSKLDLDQLKEWSNAIKNLQTCPLSIARLAFNISYHAPATQPATRPIRILCCLNNADKTELKQDFDCIISVVRNKLKISFNKDDLYTWFKVLNAYKQEDQLNEDMIKDLQGKKLSEYEIEGNPLLSLNFQLNQLLMLINNPMPFPHLDYANLFKKFINEKEKKDAEK